MVFKFSYLLLFQKKLASVILLLAMVFALAMSQCKFDTELPTIDEYSSNPQFPQGQPPEELPPLEPLSPEIEMQIIEDYRHYIGGEEGPFEGDVRIDMYCGTYKGYVAVVLDGDFEYEKVTGYGTFAYANSNTVIIWKEGLFYDNPYNLTYDGLLSYDDMESMAAYNNSRAIPIEKRPALEFLNKETEKQILKDFEDITDKRNRPVSINAYYGTYNGCVVVKMGLNRGFQLPMAVSIAVAETLFLLSTPEAVFSVWKKGQFYGLEDAYDLGLLTRDDIRSIAYYDWHQLYIIYRQ